MSKYQKLLAQRAALEAEIQTAMAEAREAALTEVKRLIGEFTFSAREIFGMSEGRKRRPTQARYRDPCTGATWSGLGRPPSWIVGKDRAQFLIAALAPHA
ncbi:H-NS family nucleoid-associated regulatory protein [Burkholderia sp. AU6039]|uniref:H-NS histone family protein n=1 Tax=Burkholderia sp. AU6039 TaxID=2015344 RepID=UPI000B7ADC39|nr:H-NS histone family protein [Burkholderia sp. AU6039]OXJ06790.1 histone [Burkholderia sp. AU6039]